MSWDSLRITVSSSLQGEGYASFTSTQGQVPNLPDLLTSCNLSHCILASFGTYPFPRLERCFTLTQALEPRVLNCRVRPLPSLLLSNMAFGLASTAGQAVALGFTVVAVVSSGRPAKPEELNWAVFRDPILMDPLPEPPRTPPGASAMAPVPLSAARGYDQRQLALPSARAS